MSEWRVKATGTTLTFTATQNFPPECTAVTYSWNRIRSGTVREVGTNSPNLSLTVNSSIWNDIYYLVLSASTTGSCTCVVGPAISRQIRVLTGQTTIYYTHLDVTPTTACSGTTWTFTAYQTGYTTPYYQFKFGISQINIGPNSTTNIYSTNNLPQPYESPIVCTVSEGVGGTNPITTNSVWIYVQPLSIPSCTITMEPASICFGQNLTFMIDTYNNLTGGVYNWWVKPHSTGIWGLVSTGGPPWYNTTSLNNNDQVKLVVTNINQSYPQCSNTGTCTSNICTASVINNVTPSVDFSGTYIDGVGAPQPVTCIQPNQQITFTATPTNGGSSPTYKWYIDSSTTATNTGVTWIYTFVNSFTGNKAIRCEMISNATCASPTVVNHINEYPLCQWNTIANVGGAYYLNFEITDAIQSAHDWVEICCITPDVNYPSGVYYNLRSTITHGNYNSVPYIQQYQITVTAPNPDITIWGRIRPQYWLAGDTIGNKYYLFYLYCHTNAIFGNKAVKVVVYDKTTITGGGVLDDYWNKYTIGVMGSQYFWYELFYLSVSNQGGWQILPVRDPDTLVFYPDGRPRNTEPPWPSYWTYPPSY